jgi:tyrosyl-tRNA synthetase
MTEADPLARLSEAAAEIVPEQGLAEKLALGRPLRVKLGLDPTAADVTLGWAVVLRKLREFQDLGHRAVLIVGDFTARVGDPSGTSETRTRLDTDVVRGYADRLLSQFWRILDEDRTEVRYNSEWLESMDMEEILRLTASTTVAQMLERDDFATRYERGRPISLMEFLYPLLQGYDSVAVEADVELGGSDQTFNLLVGRDVQRDRSQPPQVALTMPLLEGIDGVQKMSQSLGNYVGITEPPDEMFGKLMSIPDGLISKYLQLAAGAGREEVEDTERGLTDGSLLPNLAKRRMARRVVDLYHGEQGGEQAEWRFDALHKSEDISDVQVDERLVTRDVVGGDGRLRVASLLLDLGLAGSKSEARRAGEQRGVRVWWPGGDQRGERVVEDPLQLAPEHDLVGSTWSIGKRGSRMARVAGYREREEFAPG